MTNDLATDIYEAGGDPEWVACNTALVEVRPAKEIPAAERLFTFRKRGGDVIFAGTLRKP